MSSENNNSDNQQDEVSKPSIDFNTFKTYYDSNPDLDNAEYYQIFPSVNSGTIRSWKARAKTQIKEKPIETPSTPEEKVKGDNEELTKYKQQNIELLLAQTKMNPKLLEGLDDNAKLKILNNARTNAPPDPNIRLMTPSGSGSQKLGIEKYITMDEKSFKEKGFGDITVSIPASVAFNPEKSEELGKYK